MKQNVQNNKHKCCGLRWGFGSKNPKNLKKSNNTESRNPCEGKKPKQYLIATVILSVIVFVLTGASLLITRPPESNALITAWAGHSYNDIKVAGDGNTMHENEPRDADTRSK